MTASTLTSAFIKIHSVLTPWNQFFVQSRHLPVSGVFSFSQVTKTSREPQLGHKNLKSGYFGLDLKGLMVFYCRTTCSALTDFMIQMWKNYHLTIYPNYNQIIFFENNFDKI